jgi:hypothetical protein
MLVFLKTAATKKKKTPSATEVKSVCERGLGAVHHA